ncbi:hypothetical protein ABZ826_23420 [Streptomyces sp. NPDC047515]|uniref:hypothetical protein n=1 Tax=Streptomyces sp. NPDC047515 TaxID=3155380 RepID=UPI0033F7B77E
MTAPVTEQPDPPSYPPKTPPPPKKPVSPPRPNTTDGRSTGPRPLVRTARRGVGMRNRRGVNWTLESAPWAAGIAKRKVAAQLGEWGYRAAPAVAEAVAAVTGLLVTAAVADTGRRISVHLSDQDRQACILALSHQADLTPGHAPDGDDVLHQITAQAGVTGCGTDTGPDGRRIWAVVNLG